MGYFSNGAEGKDYQGRYCNKCWHDRNKSCPVWMLHLTYNGEKEKRDILNQLIPESKAGLSNQQCNLFVPLTAVDDTSLIAKQETEKLNAWNAGKAIKVETQ